MKHARMIQMLTGIFVLLSAVPASAQTGAFDITGSTGPRVGFTLVTGEIADDLQRDFGKGPVLLQFGWQVEGRFPVSPEGAAGFTQLMPLIGGLDSGEVLPSVTWLVGYRSASGIRAAFGPTISLAGPSLTLSAGLTRKVGDLRLPIDIAAQFLKNGMTVSLLVGFASR